MRTNSYEILKINKAANHCSVPECDDAFLVVSKPVTLTILDAAGTPPPAGAVVTVFDNETETTFNSTTNQSGQATFTLPFGSYRFRANFVSDGNISNGWQQVDFWSGGQNHCTLPGCEVVQMTVPKPVTATVLDGDGLPAAGMAVAAYDAVGEVSHDLTDAAGTVRLFLPEGAYRFSTVFMDVTHWSGAEGHCSTPVCESAQINIPKPVTVTVQYENGDPYPEVDVRAFIGETPSGYTAVTDAAGEGLIYAPAGAYRFAADIKGTLFYSDETNHCAIPGCETVEIEIPGGFEYREVTIDYTYDALYRLTAAEYSTGEVFEYTYDATGNRLSQTVTIDETPVTTTYTYDDANRLSQVGAQAYTWDNNGNLLSDGERYYYYDPANRLTALVEGEDTTYYLYNGQGDRIAQIEDDVQTAYILDLNAGLTQVLNDGTSAYVYGLDLVSQQTGIHEEYPLRDALGSVRQVTDQSSAITGSRNYEPYGSLLLSSGEESMAYGFAGEWTDASGMQYLRARYYDPSVGRFVSRDRWHGDENQPASYNKWTYAYSNPVNLTDPSGNFPICPFMSDLDCLSFFGLVPDYKGLIIVQLNKSAFDQAQNEIAASGLHKTTIAAAIAVQSQWLDNPVDQLKIAAYNLRSEECLNPIVDKILDSAGVGFAKSAELDKFGNLLLMSNSIKAMTDKIKVVVDECKYGALQCSEKDKLIAAAMAQNTAFGQRDMSDLAYDNQENSMKGHLEINWSNYFQDIKTLSETHPGDLYSKFNDFRALGRKNYNTRFMLQLFTQNMMTLQTLFHWDLPPGISTSDLSSMLSIAIMGK